MSASRRSPGEFDEVFYLDENPDVLEAIQRGQFPSGLAHYLTHGQYEGRLGCARESPPEYRFPGPLPPRTLRTRVHGTADLAGFEEVGKTTSDDICAAIRSRIPLDDASRVLDFGCGCGRIIAYFRHASAGMLYGTDIDAEAIKWCQENLAETASFHVNGELPPLPFDDDTFDVIFSISVLTHLPEVMQTAWLAELRRIAKPGSYVFLTTHGETLLPRVSSGERARFAQTGFLYWVHGGTEGLPDFYQDTFQTSRYINTHWSRFFEIETIVKKGICQHQDLVICRKLD